MKKLIISALIAAQCIITAAVGASAATTHKVVGSMSIK